MKVKILIPIYNDWRSAFELLKNIDQQINDLTEEVSVLIVNDGSNEEREAVSEFKNIKSIKIINMKKNKGHARCNAAGLRYILEKEDFDCVVPMDGDGEDRPEDLGLLIASTSPACMPQLNAGITLLFCKTFKVFFSSSSLSDM